MSDVIDRQTGLSGKERAPLAERILFENRIPVIIIFRPADRVLRLAGIADKTRRQF